jgi:hypothetical protein
VEGWSSGVLLVWYGDVIVIVIVIVLLLLLLWIVSVI